MIMMMVMNMCMVLGIRDGAWVDFGRFVLVQSGSLLV